VLIASFLTSLGYEFTFIQIIAGIVAVVGNVNSRELSEFFNSILFIFFAYALTFIGLSLIQEGKIMPSDGQIIWTLFINVSLVLLAYPMIPVLERLFGFTSVSSLIELSSTNRPLIKKLIQEVPGTWQHSLQVANLSEAAATAIGADAMLVKVGALYHDIGKTLTPEYFIENQQGINPHDTLTPKQSVEKIIAHVAEGVKLAKKSHVPKAIIDFIETHHGTTKVEYFYRKYKEENPEATPDEQQFRYPGTKPSTKEQAVLMIADSIEAASRTLQNPTVQDITQLIDRIITHKITDKQLEHSELTFKELEQCRTVFQQMLTSLYHTRVEYPQDIETEVSEV
jgi:putative nucleotidyltransferase with HDIG domain